MFSNVNNHEIKYRKFSCPNFSIDDAIMKIEETVKTNLISIHSIDDTIIRKEVTIENYVI